MGATRTQLISLLDSILAFDDKEVADLRWMKKCAAELADPFSRSTPVAHFTGSALVVDPSGQHVVMVLHSKLKRWLQPGGHADAADGGSMFNTAMREAREETGLDVSLHPTTVGVLDVDAHLIPSRGAEPEHHHLDVRYLLLAANPSALQHDPQESTGAQWLTWQEALARADEPALKRLLTKGRVLVEMAPR